MPNATWAMTASATIATTAATIHGLPNGRANGPPRNITTTTPTKIAHPASSSTNAAGTGGSVTSEMNGKTVKNSARRDERRPEPGAAPAGQPDGHQRGGVGSVAGRSPRSGHGGQARPDRSSAT